MNEQITFATSDFASNPEPRCPCILLLDVSGSMSGRPINELTPDWWPFVMNCLPIRWL